MKLFILCLYLTTSLCQKHYTENDLWGKPCIDDDSVPSSRKSAEEIARYSTWTLEQLNSYKDQIILKLEKEHSNFKEFFEYAEHDGKEWLREFDWYDTEVLPADKVLGELLSDDTIEDVKARLNYKEGAMTKLGATLKFFLSSFHLITTLDVYSGLMHEDLDFRRTLRETMRLLRSVTCSMNNYTKKKGNQIQVVLDDFLPHNITNIEIGLMLRDAINYLEYLKQLFEAIKINEYFAPVFLNELDLWSNPCHYTPPVNYYLNASTPETNFKPDLNRAKELAPQIVTQAKSILDDGKRFMDQYVKVLLTYPSFDQALNHTIDDEYLRKEDWYKDELLPKSKKLFTELPESYIVDLMKVFPKVVPLMHKANKLILSGLDRIILLQLHDNVVVEYNFKPIIGAYLVEVQYLLCLFSDYLRALGLGQIQLFGETRISQRWVFVIFRDSLNFVEYLSQVFGYIADKQAEGLEPFVLN